MALANFHEIDPSVARGDLYYHEVGYEDIDPDVVLRARQTHAIGYHQDMGFVDEKAVALDGTLLPDIDKARGPNVRYYLATDPENNANKATIRVVNLTQGQSTEDLPGYGLTEHVMYSGAREHLSSVRPEKLKEIAALAKTSRIAAIGLFEIMRAAVQDAEEDDTWMMAFVDTTRKSLEARFGPGAFHLLGDVVHIEDERVDGEKVEIRPVMMRPGEFYQTMWETASSTSNVISDKTKRRVGETLLFFTNGVPLDQLHEDVANWREETITSLGALAAK